MYQAGKLYFNEVEEIERSSRNWETYSLETRFEIQYQIACEESLDNLTGTKGGIIKTGTTGTGRAFLPQGDAKNQLLRAR